MSERQKALSVLTVSTLSFMVCFACWMLYGVLITFLVDNGVFVFDKSQLGWLLGIPVLTGSILRLPVGILTDKYGGRIVYAVLMIISAIAMYLVGECNTYTEFLLAGLGFGISGASFAVGIAYTSVWFPKEQQGTALGIFGAGNAGASLTSLCAPMALMWLTANAQHVENWRNLPRLYAAALLLMTLIFWVFSHPKKIEHKKSLSLSEQLTPLANIRVWRFGLYYFFVFGGFIALSQWLIPYFVNVYAMSLALAGTLAAVFSMPSGLIRAVGGWMSDKWGARTIMYWVFGSCLVCCLLLAIPRMDIESPGSGVMSLQKGTVVSVSKESITVKGKKIGLKDYPLKPREDSRILTIAKENPNMLILPTFFSWQEPVVKAGDAVEKKQLLARGVTHIFFQANMWIFLFLVLIVGVMTGIGKAAVYKYIPEYFPKDVGVVGGLVGVIGGLGGFVGPIVFGYLLESTGIWTTCWMFFAAVIVVCMLWMHTTIQAMMRNQVPDLMRRIEG